MSLCDPRAAVDFPQEVVMTLKSRKVFSAVHTAIIVLSLVSSPLAQMSAPGSHRNPTGAAGTAGDRRREEGREGTREEGAGA